MMNRSQQNERGCRWARWGGGWGRVLTRSAEVAGIASLLFAVAIHFDVI